MWSRWPLVGDTACQVVVCWMLQSGGPGLGCFINAKALWTTWLSSACTAWGVPFESLSIITYLYPLTLSSLCSECLSWLQCHKRNSCLPDLCPHFFHLSCRKVHRFLLSQPWQAPNTSTNVWAHLTVKSSTFSFAMKFLLISWKGDLLLCWMTQVYLFS